MNQTEKTAEPKKGIPFSLQIVIAVILAIVVGILLGAGNPKPELKTLIDNLKVLTDLVFQALEALAAPLIFLVLIDTLVTNSISEKEARNLVFFIAQNTAIAILIGFLVAIILSPGTWVVLNGIADTSVPEENQTLWQIIRDFINNLTPKALLQPLVENNFISLVLIALGFGFVLRGIKIEQESQGKTNFQALENIIRVLSKAIERILKWVIALLPIAVFGIVANTIAEKGFAPFVSFGALIVAVLFGCILQVCYYLIRIKFDSSVNPIDFLCKSFDTLTFAFFTASSALTMPIAWENLVEKIGLKKESASLGVYLGGNISKDAVAFFQVLFTLFVAQILGQNFSLGQYFILFLLSIFSSLCTVGIPGSALVMMILIFNTVFTNPESAEIYIYLMLSVYWFLDMCGTVINVMSYMTVSTLLDGKENSNVKG